MWEFIRNILNPKEEKPRHCVCPEEDFRYWTATYTPDCPCHGHHITADELGSKVKQEE